MSTETQENRFGVIAVKGGFITPKQLYDALRTQVMEELEGSEHHLIGEILHKKGYMTTAQIDEVLEFVDML
jgi:hypothetical protein